MSSPTVTVDSAKPLSTRQVVIRITIIIGAVESLIMLALGSIPHEASTLAEAVMDTGLLIIFSIPAIFLWVIRPFVTARNQALAQVSHLALDAFRVGAEAHAVGDSVLQVMRLVYDQKSEWRQHPSFGRHIGQQKSVVDDQDVGRF